VSRNPLGFVPMLRIPLSGSSPSCAPKSQTTMMPTQNVGKLRPMSAPKTVVFSNRLPRYQPVSTPSVIPMMYAMTNAVSINTSVFGRNVMMTSLTCAFVLNDRPRSNVARF